MGKYIRKLVIKLLQENTLSYHSPFGWKNMIIEVLL